MPAPDLSRRTFLGAVAGSTAGGAMLSAVDGFPGSVITPAAAAPRKPTARGFDFVHPGMLHTAADLARMKAGVAEGRQPLLDGFRALAADPRSAVDYVIRNTGQVTTWGRGPTDWTAEAASDAAAAYQQALMWAVTGERRHANLARDILDAWTASLTAITGADGQLGAGLQAVKFLNGAEILRHTAYRGWPAADIDACVRSFRTVWYPSISGYALFANGNWDVAALQGVLAIAIFCDDTAMFEDAIRYAVDGAGNGRLTHVIVSEAGQGQESGRTQAYAQLAVGLLASVAEMAWSQGVDLYGFAGRRLLAGHEYVARYNLGHDVDFEPDLDRTGKYLKTAVAVANRGQFRPIWERPLAHYEGRLGVPAPYSRQVVLRGPGGTRVIEGYHEDHPGWGALTCADPDRVGRRALGRPAAPAGLTARPVDDGIHLGWVGSIDPRSGAPATSYTIKRASTPNGPFLTVATRVHETTWTDRRTIGARVHSYVVVASNAQGESRPSVACSLAATLPRPWQHTVVGSARPVGTAAFDGQRFVVESGGRQIAGAADDFGFVYARLRGNGTITARLVDPISSQYATLGVMMRADEAPDAPHAAMMIKGLPLHTWSGVFVARAGRGAASRVAGSDPVPPSQHRAITVDAGFPISELGDLPTAATPLAAPYVEAASDGFRLRRPYWVRLTRRGSLFVGAISPDGSDWTEVGRAEIELPRAVRVGLAVCSGLGVPEHHAETTTAAFDNVAVTGWQTPAPQGRVSSLQALATDDAIELSWSDAGVAGSAHAGSYTIRRGSSPDGPFDVLAREIEPVGFGVALRYLDATGRPGRAYSYVVSAANVDGTAPPSNVATARMPRPPLPEVLGPPQVHGTVGTLLAVRLDSRGEPTRFTATGLPRGLRLDPLTGVLQGVPRSAGSARVVVTATNAAASVTSAVEVSVGLPVTAPWSAADVGDTVTDTRRLGAYGVVLLRRPGITSLDPTTGEYTVRGAGTGLNVIGQGYAGQLAATPMTGDGTIIARLVRQSDTATTDQVGLIMAKSRNPFDQLAALVVSHQSDGRRVAQFVRRTKVAGGYVAVSGPAVNDGPVWLRLTRTGVDFEAAVSVDGSAWTVLGVAPVDTFGHSAYHAGLVVTSGTPSRLSTAVFDSVRTA